MESVIRAAYIAQPHQLLFPPFSLLQSFMSGDSRAGPSKHLHQVSLDALRELNSPS
jgi:hypothetical protein